LSLGKNKSESESKASSAPPALARSNFFWGGRGRATSKPKASQELTAKYILRGFGVAVGSMVRPWAQLRQERAPFIFSPWPGRERSSGRPLPSQPGQGGQWAWRGEAAAGYPLEKCDRQGAILQGYRRLFLFTLARVGTILPRVSLSFHPGQEVTCPFG